MICKIYSLFEIYPLLVLFTAIISLKLASFFIEPYDYSELDKDDIGLHPRFKYAHTPEKNMHLWNLKKYPKHVIGLFILFGPFLLWLILTPSCK